MSLWTFLYLGLTDSFWEKMSDDNNDETGYYALLFV